MSGVSNKSKKGILRRGWTASVDDYAISGGWSLGGEALMGADASGGIFAFDGKSGEVLWSQKRFMMEVDWQPRSIRVEPNSRPQARMDKYWFGMFLKEMSCKRSMQAADG